MEGLDLPSVIVAERAVEAQSLVALADLVVSAGGTMNREAAALGTPVYTTFAGRLGGVDEALIRSGRLRPLTDPRALELEKRSAGNGQATLRDPSLLVDLILGTVDMRRAPAFVLALGGRGIPSPPGLPRCWLTEDPTRSMACSPSWWPWRSPGCWCP